jgi:polyhydroxybutyrate depolymerase
MHDYAAIHRVEEKSVRRIRAIAAVVAAFYLLMGCAGPKPVSAAGELSRHSITVGDLERSYLLYTPPGVENARQPRPLVLVFHGGGGTAQGIAREVGRSLHGIADREGFFVAYPHAIDKIWDFGAGLISDSLEVRVDDRAYFAAVLDELSSTRPIDRQRVFATGISRGGQASYFVACVFPDRIRAIAAVTMPMPTFMLGLCDNSASIGVAVLNGTKDPLVPYDGGQITVGRKERGEVMSTDDTIDFWRTRNRCSETPSGNSIVDHKQDRMQVFKTSWEDCEYDPVLLYRIEGGGHTWPSGRQYLPRFLVGPVNRDIDAASEIWTFFSRF